MVEGLTRNICDVIIFNLDRTWLKDFPIFSSGGQFVQQNKQNVMSNFGTGHFGEHLCKFRLVVHEDVV